MAERKAPGDKEKDEKTTSRRTTRRGRRKSPAPDLEGRIDGLRGWADQIERRQSRMMWIGGALLAIAIGLSAAALYIAMTSKSDNEDDIDALREDVTELQEQVSTATEDELRPIRRNLRTLTQQVTNLTRKQGADARDIASIQGQITTLRSQIGGANAGAGGGGGGGNP